MPSSSYFLGLWAALSISLIAAFILKPFARRLDLMDHPGGRKHHASQTPLIGGLVIFLGLFVSVFIIPVPMHYYLSMLIGGALLLFVGCIDDLFDINPRIRLIAQVLSAVCIAFGGHTVINYVGDMFFVHDMYLNTLALPITLFLIVSYINALNMLDGQDGLAGGIVFLQGLLLLFISMSLEMYTLAMILGIFLAVTGLFLCFNVPLPWRKHASMFLGDSGSNLVAFIIAWAVIVLSQAPEHLVKPVTLVWIVSFPLYDIASVCIIRKEMGQPCLKPGHDHIHHLLQRKNISKALSTVYLCLFSLILGLTGLFLAWMNVPEKWQFVLLLLLFGMYFKVTRRLTEDTGSAPYDDARLQPDI